MKYTPRLPEENVNVSPGGPLREFAKMFAGAVLLLVMVYILLGVAVDRVVPHISPTLERAIGRHLLGTIPRAEVPDVRERILQTIVNELQASCIDLPYQPTVHFVESEAVNAVALPGGHIVVFSGLLEKLNSLNEVAFVLAHEAGHFEHRDHLRALGRSLVLMTMSAALFGGDSRIGGVLSGWLNIAEMGFSRQQETRADEYGLRVLNCRFGHVSGAAAFFETLAEEDKTGMVRHYFSTHPRNRKRIAHLIAYSEKHGFPRGRLNPLPGDLRPSSPEETPRNGGSGVKSP